MMLPKEKEGRPYISYSQIQLWNSLKSFNLGIPGKQEYIIQYFEGKKFRDQGWAEFGNDVEEYITKREKEEKFTEEERKVLNEIQTLGKFQTEGLMNMGEFDVLMYIDDCKEDYSRIRDYKTGSKSSLKKYEKPDYKQLHIYASWIHQETGVIPECEVVCIERKGNCMMGKGRKALTIGKEVNTINITVTEKDILEIKKEITETALEIEKHFIIYNQLKGIK